MSADRWAHKVRLARAIEAARSPPPPPLATRAPTPREPKERRRWWPWGRDGSDRETVEVAVGVDSPSDLFVLRRCDLCGSQTWLAAERARALRIACRRCAADLRAPRPRPEPKATPAPKAAPSRPHAAAPAPDPEGDARRRGQLAAFLEEEIAEGHRLLERYGPTPGATERAASIRDWNAEYERNVEADVTDTLALSIPRREGEPDAAYIARLKRTAERWRTQRARSIFPPTPSGVAQPPPAQPESPPTARRAGRTTAKASPAPQPEPGSSGRRGRSDRA